jgi:hypothetical protein
VERRMVATHALVKEYVNLFVNRRAYTVQSFRPHPQRERHYYYRPTERGSGASLHLNEKTMIGQVHSDAVEAVCDRRARGTASGEVWPEHKLVDEELSGAPTRRFDV